MSESRTLFVWMLYNWRTREKQFRDYDSIGEWLQANPDFAKDPDVKLYLFEAELEPPKDGPPPVVWLRLVREEAETRRKPRPDESEFEYTSGALSTAMHEAVPPGSFGPDKGPLCCRVVEKGPDKTVYRLSTPSTGYKITIERTEPWSPPNWPKVSK